MADSDMKISLADLLSILAMLNSTEEAVLDENVLVGDLMDLVEKSVHFHMKIRKEIEAVDLLTEVEAVNRIVDHVDSTSSEKIQRCCYFNLEVVMSSSLLNAHPF
ncbi:hypothetical protein GIB67_007783 [Kingdonia uniflora]|uniref:RPN1 N-terminal domain-containing protein n=1 Tax=Kingdonia uniflora TaxID=39325 RepID=A0A7J7N292_9MAGN|nr:hypothetical protein GIB67_007783 [Kingdonia uniflora]